MGSTSPGHVIAQSKGCRKDQSTSDTVVSLFHPPVTLTVYGLVESMLIDQDPVMLSVLTFKRRKFPAVVMDARAPFVWLELWETPGKAGNVLE